jgi:GcrA cell cycle regulator
MIWNDARIELLKQLWSDGLSAGQIASRLPGVTRNAVLGKVHRLGLSGRATIITDKGTQHAVGERRSKKGVARARNMIATAKALAHQIPEAILFIPPADELDLPLGERRTLLVLKDGKLHADDTFGADCCHWPIGDPQAEDFHFCSRKKVRKSSYCEFHFKMAFQLVPRRNRAA